MPHRGGFTTDRAESLEPTQTTATCGILVSLMIVCCPSATIAIWSSAWLHGFAASDDVLDALELWGESHEFVAGDARSAQVFELPPAGQTPATPAEVLGKLRTNKISTANLVLPVPGDVRGLAANTALSEAALATGEAVILSDERKNPRHGLVPRKIATGLLRWTVYTPETPIYVDHVGFKDAERSLNTALNESAESLAALNVAKERPEIRAELASQLRGLPNLNWPSGTPGPALRLLQRVNEIAAILMLANGDEPGGAVSASAAQLRSETLRTLDAAVRTARRAAVNEAIRVLTESETV